MKPSHVMDDENQENEPLTPRESVESMPPDRSNSYLAFFRSPPPPPSTLLRARRQPLTEEQNYILETNRHDEEEHTSSYVPHSITKPSLRSCPHREDSENLSVLSSASHLFGESLISLEASSNSTGAIMPNASWQSEPNNLRPNVLDPSPPNWQMWWNQATDATLNFIDVTREQVTSILRNRSTVPLSPRSRRLLDLHYLTHQHEQKIREWIPEEQDYYDFCLVLVPQEVYAFWAERLDFRPELLGHDGLFVQPPRSFSTDQESTSSVDDQESEGLDRLTEMATPTTGMRRRFGTQDESINNTSMLSYYVTKPSPGVHSVSSRNRSSVFERAIGSPTPKLRESSDVTPLSRRRWGNQVATRTVFSPPIRSLTRGATTVVRRPAVVRHTPAMEDEEIFGNSELDPNVLRMEDIPNQVIPRGIAKINTLLPFLSALHPRRGIVVRRHRPNHESVFVKLFSTDGGDTIQYQYLEEDEAMNAFREQRVKYNKNDVFVQPWSYKGVLENFEDDPNQVAVQQSREDQKQRGLTVNDITRNARSGSLKTADIIRVHPSKDNDPRTGNGFKGTASLRRSQCEYSQSHSFSLVLRNAQSWRGDPQTLAEWEQRWCDGEGNENQFKYLDLEAATEGEFWLVLRGFLHLQRDAVNGRFAEQRAAGIGSHYSRLLADLDRENRLHINEYLEPVTAGWLEKRIVKWRELDETFMKGETRTHAKDPPPSDYFLGFNSPGTSIWSRLRQADLETERVYSLDPRRVMIKVRCPADRLMDVAEVLRVKLRTRDGSFAPFREDSLEIYKPLQDPCDELPNTNNGGFHFCSSIRQTVIDFIVRSRIRDSGAQLGQTTDLGKMILARVPLHMHEKLESLFNSWFYFWRIEHWRGRDDCSMPRKKSFDENDERLSLATESTDTDSTENSHSKKAAESMPNKFERFLRGAFYQPLGSIEQYFGEKVAFYFAWLQHTSRHLLFLSFCGLIVFIAQLGSGNWDHPLRPVLAMIIMLWTFIVLIDWRKRANFLAYRWGTMNYKEQETTRPQFHGDYVRDKITNEWVVVYPKWKRWLKYAVSFPLTLLFTTGTLILILWVHANRDLQLANYIEQKNNPDSAEFKFNFALSAIGKKAPITQVDLSREHLYDIKFWFIVVFMPALLGLFLPLLNLILMKISVMLNDFENYRTETEYRTYLIIKVFSFRFMCYFATLYYYSFISVGSKQAVENGILKVGSSVLVYTTVAQWWQIFLHVYFPILIRKIRMRLRHGRITDELGALEIEEEQIARLAASEERSAELEARQARAVNKRLLIEQALDPLWLEVMLPQHDSFPEYIQAVVQFTFVVCFSVVLPITPLICLFNYLLLMRLDAYKLCKGRRRPLAEKTGGMGVWEHLLHIVAVISVLTNCWLMGFTSTQFTWLIDAIGEIGLFAIVVLWEHIMLLIKYIMQSAISPLPKVVRDEIRREQYELEQQRNSTMRVRQGRRSQHRRDESITSPVNSGSSSHSLNNTTLLSHDIEMGDAASEALLTPEPSFSKKELFSA